MREDAIICCPRPRFSLLGLLCLLARSVIVTLPLHKITYSCTNIMGYKNVTYIHSVLLTRGSFVTLRMTSRATEIATSGTALLAMTTPCVVILNGVKNLLEADKRPRTRCVANEGILRYTQDDIPSNRDCHVGHSPPRNDDTMRCHSERSEESPRSRQATTHIVCCQRGDPSLHS